MPRKELEMEQIKFYDETTGEEILFEIVDQAIIDKVQYLLVADEDDNANILKAIKDDEQEITYKLVDNDFELQKATLIFLESDEYDIEV